jgi:hypothetical protein
MRIGVRRRTRDSEQSADVAMLCCSHTCCASCSSVSGLRGLNEREVFDKAIGAENARVFRVCFVFELVVLHGFSVRLNGTGLGLLDFDLMLDGEFAKS